MSGNNFVVDTNILIALYNNNSSAKSLLRNATIYISFITEVELLGYNKLSDKDRKIIDGMLAEFEIIDSLKEIKHLAVDIRSKYKVKLPDAFIAATSIYLNLPLLTADIGFKKIKELNSLIIEL